MVRKRIFSIDFHDIDLNDVFQKIQLTKFDGLVIVTPNVDHVNRYNKVPEFREIYDQADIFLNDSRVLKLFSFFLKDGINHVVPGSDLTKLIFERHREIASGYRLCVLGASHSDILSLKDKYSISDIYHYDLAFGFENDEEEIKKCISYCKSLPKCIYFISVGSPRQEILANRLKKQGVGGVFLCVGASVLFLTGKEKRAPLFIQTLNLEWLFRLAQSPRRLYKRYLIDGPYIFKLFLKEIFD